MTRPTPPPFEQPRLSPDGTQAAFRVFDNIDVWIHSLVRGSITRLRFHSDEDETPIWAPDGKLVAFASDRGIPKRVIHTKPPDGSVNEQPIGELTGVAHLSSWSSDGKTIAYGECLDVVEREQGLQRTQRAVGIIDQLALRVVPADRPLVFEAAHVKARYPISYADAFSVALAKRTRRPPSRCRAGRLPSRGTSRCLRSTSRGRARIA